MEEKKAMPITYEQLKQEMAESGRPYDFELVDRAYALAAAAHEGQFRRSGEPYICHPLSVARILVELGMDSESVAAALMHDVAEDTAVSIDEIRQKFGAQVALLVDGVTKLTQITFSNVEDRQAENLRKMLLAMSQDVRVMIIKLCDRLHNMRTGDAWPEQKRRDKALETMEVYAPIAHRLGISNIKEELEDRSLRYLDPVGYEHIRSLLNKHGGEFLDSVCETIRVHLQENGIHGATIRHRVKSIYGIYRKMYMQSKDFEEIYDVYAVRIIVDSVAECYTALGLIHDMYHPLPNRFKDYISTPKPNGYQSLHTTVIGREPIPFEVQIRTWDMALPPTGSTRPVSRAATKSWRSALPGCASCSKASARAPTRPTCSATSSPTCCRRKSLPSHRAATSSTCRSAPPSSTSPMRSTRRSATA